MRNLMTLILKNHMASKVMEKCRTLGALGGTVVYGEGTCQSPLLKFLEMDREKKEILMMIIEDEDVERIMEFFHERFQKPNTAIGFVTRLNKVYGVCRQEHANDEIGGSMEAIYVIVDRGKSEEVINIAQEQGAGGATILHGRGAGAKMEHSLFDLTIEPEKEVILMLVPKEKTQSIIDEIYDAMDLDTPNSGILFTLPVHKTFGLREV